MHVSATLLFHSIYGAYTVKQFTDKYCIGDQLIDFLGRCPADQCSAARPARPHIEQATEKASGRRSFGRRYLHIYCLPSPALCTLRRLSCLGPEDFKAGLRPAWIPILLGTLCTSTIRERSTRPRSSWHAPTFPPRDLHTCFDPVRGCSSTCRLTDDPTLSWCG